MCLLCADVALAGAVGAAAVYNYVKGKYGHQVDSGVDSKDVVVHQRSFSGSGCDVEATPEGILSGR
jgi:hypothetical protein